MEEEKGKEKREEKVKKDGDFINFDNLTSQGKFSSEVLFLKVLK